MDVIAKYLTYLIYSYRIILIVTNVRNKLLKLRKISALKVSTFNLAKKFVAKAIHAHSS